MATKKKTTKATTVWVYQDSDHGDVELFSTLEAAKKHAEANWPDVSDEYDGDGWQESSRSWSFGEYVQVFERTIDG